MNGDGQPTARLKVRCRELPVPFPFRFLVPAWRLIIACRYPSKIPSNTSIPHWAYLDWSVSALNRWTFHVLDGLGLGWFIRPNGCEVGRKTSGGHYRAVCRSPHPRSQCRPPYYSRRYVSTIHLTALMLDFVTFTKQSNILPFPGRCCRRRPDTRHTRRNCSVLTQARAT